MTVVLDQDADEATIYRFLQADPVWAAYAIGDLEPGQDRWCQWHVHRSSGEVDALALVYRRLEPPVLLTVGSAQGVQAILRQAPLPRQITISALADHLPALQERYDFSGGGVRSMLRMTVTRDAFEPVTVPTQPSPRRLGVADVPAIEALFTHGGPYTPDAFMPAQVAEGVFYGLEAPGSSPVTLLALAGTHLVAPTMAVAALGNLYVDPFWRGRGFGRLVTSVVTAELLERGLLVALNVDQANSAAIHLYEGLGYRRHCAFYEGIGVTNQPTKNRYER